MPAPSHPRALPGQPNLRHLKLQAKRRLAAGEFPALHDAQTAIAREHGLPTDPPAPNLDQPDSRPDQPIQGEP